MRRTNGGEPSEYQALAETGLLLAGALDMRFVLDNLLLILMGKLLIPRAAFLLYDPVTDSYRVMAVKGVRQIRPGDILHLPEGERGIPPELRQSGFRHSFPVVYQERLLGILLLGDRATGQPLSEEDRAFVETFLNFTSVAIHSALLVEELKQANRELDARIQALNTLFELSKEFNRTLDRNRLLRLLAYALMGQLVVRRFVFLLRREGQDGPCEGDYLEVVAARNMPDLRLPAKAQRRLCTLTQMQLLDEATTDDALVPFRRAGIQLLIPLEVQGTVQGILGLGPKMTREPFTPEEIEFVYSVGTLALIALQNTYLIEARLEKERLEEELRLARRIQEQLLPRHLPELPGVELAGIAMPSRQVGGDFYDARRLPGERLLLGIADVTGKGVPAALLMANLQASLRVILDCERKLSRATERLNRIMYENTDAAHFVTFFWGIWESHRRRLRYVNAGHNPPLLFRSSGRVDRLRKGGLLLGAFPSASYEEGRAHLRPGEVLVCYTDGVTEAVNAQGEEFGERRLIRWVRKHISAPAQEILRGLVEEVRSFSGKEELDDDLTLLVLKAH